MGDLMTLYEMRQHEWVVSWSGGKDSTATIILMHEHRVPIKKIVYVRMMYDETLPATLPIMTEFVDRAAEVFRAWGNTVEIVKSLQNAKDLSNKIFHNSTRLEINGRRYGVFAFARGRCKMAAAKSTTIQKLNNDDDYEMIGYAADELQRLHRLGGRKQSIMFELGVPEDATFEICRRYNLLSPLYGIGAPRDGCFFCPNAGTAQRRYLHRHYPELVKIIYNDIINSPYDPNRRGNFPNNWIKDFKETHGRIGGRQPITRKRRAKRDGQSAI